MAQAAIRAKEPLPGPNMQKCSWSQFPQGLSSCVRTAICKLVPQGRLNLAQDAVLGRARDTIQSRKGRLKITGPSDVPAGLSFLVIDSGNSDNNGDHTTDHFYFLLVLPSPDGGR